MTYTAGKTNIYTATAVTQAVSVTVIDPSRVAGVTLNKTAAAVGIGRTEQLTATVSPDTAANKNVTWSSSDTSIAAVSENGLVTAISPGTAVITVTTADCGYTADCEVTVYDVVLHSATVRGINPYPPAGWIVDYGDIREAVQDSN